MSRVISERFYLEVESQVSCHSDQFKNSFLLHLSSLLPSFSQQRLFLHVRVPICFALDLGCELCKTCPIFYYRIDSHVKKIGVEVPKDMFIFRK